MDIIERLRTYKTPSPGATGLMAEAAVEIERLRNENAHLQFCLNSRDDFLGAIGQWQAYVDTLPNRKAGVPGGWSENRSDGQQAGKSQ